MPVRDANPELLHARLAGRVIVTLGDHHVAPVAPSALEVAPPGRVLLDGSDDLEELIAHGHEHVLEPEDPDAGIAMTNRDPQDLLELRHGGGELSRDESDLAQSQPHAFLPFDLTIREGPGQRQRSMPS